MLKCLFLIGIGPGHPKYLTLEAVNLIQRLNLFFIPEKMGQKMGLTKVRKEVVDYVKGDKPYRIVALPFPEREKGLDYHSKVSAWRGKKAQILREYILKEDGEAGFLIWGDPSIYDGHVEVAKRAIEGLGVELVVVPGLSAYQILGAKHKISLTELASPLTFHTPRSLRRLKKIENNTVVFLDNYETFKLFRQEELLIYWGAYLGIEAEELICGKLKEVWPKITQRRKELKKTYGYLMDIYLLKPFQGDE